MENKNHIISSHRHMVIFLGTSNDGMAAHQEVGCRIAETFKIPLAKVLAALMRVPFPVGRDLTLEAANDLVQTLRELGANAVKDSEGEWPSEARMLLNLQPSLLKEALPSIAVGLNPSLPAQTGKSDPAGRPAVATDQLNVTKPVADDGCGTPSVQVLRKPGSRTVTDSEGSEPSEAKISLKLESPLPEKIQPSGADEQVLFVPAESEKGSSVAKPTVATDQVKVTKPLAGDQCVKTSVETDPNEPLADGLTNIDNLTARSSDKPATAVPITSPTQLGGDPDFPEPEDTPASTGKKPRRPMKYLALAVAVLLLLAIGELVVSHTEWLPFSFGRDRDLQAQLTEQSALEKQLYFQAQTLEEFGSNSQVILTAWQDYVETCPNGQYADRAKQQLAYWQDYRSVDPATPPVTKSLMSRAVKRELKPYLKSKDVIPIPDLDDPEPVWDPSFTTEVAAVENLPDWIVDMPSNSPLPDSPVRVGPGVTAPVVVQRVEPEFPHLARQVRAQGEVLLQATILRDGSVNDVTVLKSLSRKLGCDKAAVEAIKKWKFKPGKMNGRPVDVIIELRINFVP